MTVRRRRRRGRAVLVAVMLATTVGCGAPASTQGTAPTTPTPTPFLVPTPPEPAPVTDTCPPAPPRPAVLDPQELTTEEQAGLVLAVGVPHALTAEDAEAAEAADLGVGGIILKRANVQSAEQARALVDDLAAASPHGLLVFVDHEGGRVAHADAVVPTTPSARRLGEAGPEAAAEAARTIGTALRSIGVHADLGPVADLDGGAWDGIIGDRAFGDTAAEVTPAAVAFVEGLHQRGTLAVVKHFPGYAGAEDTHGRASVVDVSLSALRRDHLPPFRALVDAGADAVMVAHVSYAGLDPALPASLDPQVYALLRETGFDGVAMTDSLGMGAAQRHGGHGGAAVAALAAGADLLLANQGSDAAREMRDAIVDAVESGEVSAGRLLEAATRVMRLRARQWEVAAGCR